MRRAMAEAHADTAEDDPPAERARRPFPAHTGVADVVRVTTVTPHMARLTLGGPALDGFAVDEPGEIVTLLWPAEGQELVLPRGGWRFPPGVADAQHARNYTVRRWNAAAGELDIDFFLHGDEGRAARWANRVRVGDTVGFAGPRVHWVSGPADWTLLVADETGLPALAAIAEELPAGHPAIALVEIDGAAERQIFDTAARLDLRWLDREGAAPGTTSLLFDAVAALELPRGAGRAWGGAEAMAMRDVRRHLQGERGLPAGALSVLGYCKHRTTPEWD